MQCFYRPGTIVVPLTDVDRAVLGRYGAAGAWFIPTESRECTRYGSLSCSY